jgi:tetratricopeptide (TPR) repeat protein
MQNNNSGKVKVTFREKVSLLIFSFFLFIILLETGLRLAGFILSSIQEYRNLQSAKQKGAYRIMCVGESTTAGQYPAFLEEILNQRNIGIKFSVINKGVTAINTTLILANLESDINNYRPDMVIAMMGINDSGKFVSCGVTAGSKAEVFLKSLRIYKLARLIWLHMLAKAEEAKVYSSSRGLKEFHSEVITIENSLKKNLSLGAGDYRAYLNLGLFYREQGRFVESREAFTKALELSPNNEQIYFELGWFYRKQEDFPRAEESWKKVLELNPKSDLAYSALAWLNRKRGNFVQAEALSKEALKLNPGNDLAYNTLGWAYCKQEKFILAEEAFKKAVQLNPKKVKAYTELGQFYQDQGKFSEAREIFSKVLELNPKNDHARAALPLLYQKMGKMELAQEYARQADRLKSEYYKPVTVYNYRKLRAILDNKGIKFVCMQYPVRNIEPLRKIFEGNEEGIIFVDNEKVFKAALKKDGRAKYFNDMFGGDFGHCTDAGNRLLAENAASTILQEVFNDFLD